MQLFTFLLVVAGLAHAWLQLLNRSLLLLTEGRRKDAVIQLSFLCVFVVPSALLLFFSQTDAVRQALAWEPATTASRILFGLFGLLWIGLLWRGGAWLTDRFVPANRSARARDRIIIPSITKGRPRLPRFLGLLETTYDLEVVERDIEVPNLAAGFDGLTIAHVADIHYDPRLIRHDYYDTIERIVNSYAADVVVFTGDFINHPRLIRKSVEYHARMRGRLATLCVFGNHDYWTNPRLVREECLRRGIRPMHNRRWVIERDGRRLLFAGTDVPWCREKTAWGALLSHGTGEAVILLSHTPDNAAAAARNGANLILAGHNHGGQYCLPLLGAFVVPSRIGHRYLHGVYDVSSECVLSVSRGIGSSTDREGHGAGRILCPPELIIYTLRAPILEAVARADDESALRNGTVIPIPG